jgi:hypothetical protein
MGDVLTNSSGIVEVFPQLPDLVANRGNAESLKFLHEQWLWHSSQGSGGSTRQSSNLKKLDGGGQLQLGGKASRRYLERFRGSVGDFEEYFGHAGKLGTPAARVKPPFAAAGTSSIPLRRLAQLRPSAPLA